MSMDYIRKTYGVPAKRGARIAYTGSVILGRVFGTIVGTQGAYLRVRMDDGHPGERVTMHPTWHVEYLETPATRSQMLARHGYKRRPTWRSLPSDE